MSDGLITPAMLEKAWRLTATPNMVDQEMRRMKQEEPHLYAHVRFGLESLARNIMEDYSPSDAADLARASAEHLMARVWIAFRLGREKLWRETSGVPADGPHPEEIPVKPLTARVREEVRALLAAGRKVEAIARIREGTFLGLKEAKDIADRLEAEKDGGRE